MPDETGDERPGGAADPTQSEPTQSEPTSWRCGRCDVPLELGTIRVAYLDTEQPVELARCPRCGLVMVPEDLALGRILEVEQLLEDK